MSIVYIYPLSNSIIVIYVNKYSPFLSRGTRYNYYAFTSQMTKYKILNNYSVSYECKAQLRTRHLLGLFNVHYGFFFLC